MVPQSPYAGETGRGSSLVTLRDLQVLFTDLPIAGMGLVQRGQRQDTM